MTNPDIQQAKEWAESRAYGNYVLSEETLAAVKVIQSLPGHWIDAEGLATLSDLEKSAQHAAFGTDGELTREQLLAFAANVERTIHKLLTPPLPTLADMTPEEREACLWMQVDLPRHLPGAVLADPGGPGTEARVMYQDGATFTVKHEEATPLPGEPKLEWPSLPLSDESEAVSVETEDVTEESDPDLPRPEDVPAGEPWLVGIRARNGIQDRQKFFGIRSSGGTWELFDINEGWHSRWGIPSDITLVSRLVQEDKP